MPASDSSTPTPDDRRFASWIADLRRIQNDVYAVHHHRFLWRELAEMTENAKLPASVFFDALGVWYAGTQAVAVRRQLDPRRRTVSLRRLLEDIARRPQAIDRERHVALWNAGDDPLFWEEAHLNFDRFSGGRQLDHIDVAIVRADIQELVDVGEIVKRHVDEAVAHTALEPEHEVPTFADLNAVIDKVAELVKKYTSLLEATIIWQMEPVIQDDWTAIFRQAWLPARP